MAEPQTAVVFSGGGANGAFEVGVLKALMSGKSPATGHQPLVPDILTGTSIGAFNAAYITAHWDRKGSALIGDLERLWLEGLCCSGRRSRERAIRFRGDPFTLLDPRSYVANPLQPLRELAGDTAFLGWKGLRRLVHMAQREDRGSQEWLAGWFSFASFVSRDHFNSFIKMNVPGAGIRHSSRKLRIAATNWATGKLKIFQNGDMTDKLGPQVLMASSAIPGIFPPEEVGSQLFCDGGVLMNTPLKPAIRSGAKVIHAVYLDPHVESIPLEAFDSTLDTFYRTQLISWAATVNDDINDAGNINDILDLLDELGPGEAGTVGERFRDRYEAYQRLIIHRYHPNEDLGGATGLLNMSRPRIEDLVHRGFNEAAYHDCERAQCVLTTFREPAAAGARAAGEKQG